MQISRAMPMPPTPVDTGQRTAMSFEVDLRKHAVTVSVVDRRSGEVLQQVVYDKYLPSPQSRWRRAGALLDVQA